MGADDNLFSVNAYRDTFKMPYLFAVDDKGFYEKVDAFPFRFSLFG